MTTIGQSSDTIVAQVTPPGRGGVAVVRVSGAQVKAVCQQVVGQLPEPRYATLLPFLCHDKTVFDEGLVLFFPGPHSFTGEDVVEFHCHGGPVVVDQLLKTTLMLDQVRMAKPGEFSERAFVNDKMDLAQAEAIADLINASSIQAATSAAKSLQGAFSAEINQLLEQVIQLRVYVEAAIDFPEEEIDFLTEGKVEAQLAALQKQLNHTLSQARQGALLQQGMTLVIAGKPNVGKSSLLNALARKEAAIVTDIAGTTRDVVREDIQLNGVPLHVVDTAGLRQSDDPVEQEGIRRAQKMMQQADHLLLVVDSAELSNLAQLKASLLVDIPEHIRLTVVANKVDVHPIDQAIIDRIEDTVIALSAKTKKGLEQLEQHLLQSVGYDQTLEGGFIARRRHITALKQAAQHMDAAMLQCREYQAGEFIAEELRYVQQALAEITGVFRSDDLLGEIFSSFCIGK